MDWDGSLEQLTQSVATPAWLAVGCAAVFGLLFLFALMRAERSLANAALAALTFAGLALAAAMGLRTAPAPERQAQLMPAVAALSCVDDMAGETTLAACESILFGSPDIVAAAVAYTAARIDRLIALGDAGGARAGSRDQLALRKAIERDRYGLAAYVLSAREGCQPNQCAAYAALTDHAQIAANMEGLIYEGLVAKYSPIWPANAGSPLASAPTVSVVPSQAPLVGRPNNVDFPSAASIPPVNIMTGEPLANERPEARLSLPEGAPQAGSAPNSGGPYVSPTVAARKHTPPRKRSTPPSPAPSAEQPVQLTPQ